MRDKLRRRYQVQREVARGGVFEGEFALSELTRVGELLHRDTADEDPGRVRVRFEFRRNEFDIPMISGRLETSLELECQRCLRSLRMPLGQDFRLMIDADDEMQRVSGIDSLPSEEGSIDLFDLVEDEILLAIPIVAMHEDSGCNEYWPDPSTDSGAAERDNPFAVLAQLKTTDSI